MGGGASITYCVPVTQKPEGESSTYRCPSTKDKLYSCPTPELNTMKQVILNSLKQFANRPALGKIVSKDNKPAIEYLTFKEALTRAHHLGSGIIQQNMFNVPEGETMKLLGIFSKNRVEWGLTDMACLLFGITTIPLYDTLGD